MNRRSFIKRSLWSILTVIGAGSGGYYYARNIEPSLLQIKKETIASSKIPSSFDGFKIIQFSDTHIGFHYTIEQLKDLVHQINMQDPDMVVFTGDLIDAPNQYHQYADVHSALLKINANYGKYWIYGNHDHGGYGTEIIKELMQQSQFTLLQNNHAIIEKNVDRIIIAGIDDVILGNPDLNKTLYQTNSDLFTILLAHEPDFAETTRLYPVNIQLSGHSHGGQVRFPFLGHLYTPAYAEKYVQGKYTFDNENEFTLYVNSGIGTTRLPYRFLCNPEFHVYTLKHTV
ncbi:metallophosphoesterase [Oceanobacillus bengalensis]|uniref:Metallophosphoesterase n=1 Tax=Oceanobacillus bengalensis TaxID=1435466 RepID=A0A494Z1M2_9BACI|nr:metallophosphoesterase [Oceanobacillus bengalensis]RKQ16367.1 metallophosphoesterase [Oceanobacillus bengalensis]